MTFIQSAPTLGNQFDDDRLLGEYIERHFSGKGRDEVVAELRTLGALSGGAFYQLQLADRQNDPVHKPFDAWGNRIDEVEVSPLWKEAQSLAARHGLVAAGYEPGHGPLARLHQFSMVHVIGPSLDVYTCPLAMTDGAVRTLLDSGNQALIEHAVPKLTSRDPAVAWTSGQWMTERTGGSDVGLSETVARKEGDTWRLSGVKWFTSGVTAEMALTLGRPDGNGPGGRGLALFYVELREASGKMNGITVHRLKDKLGTRKVPTAEIELEGAVATLVREPENGVRNITPMLNITRTWNAVSAASGMRRALALAYDFATKRHAFGAALIDKPLHVDTLEGISAIAEGAFHLAFRAVELVGRREHGLATEQDELLARVLIPIAKLTTGKQAVTVASEAIESFGGAGYVEDTGLPRLLADAQVLPIWEGTTNVLSLDTLRALRSDGALEALTNEARTRAARGTDERLRPLAERVEQQLDTATRFLGRNRENPLELERGARRFALCMGTTLELSYLIDHAQWCLDHHKGDAAVARAERFARGEDLAGWI